MAEDLSRKPGNAHHAKHFLKPRQRSTPCVGICSTSHGDFVCRGCKRFFNEVRDWQSFSSEQREMVLSRLGALKRDSVLAVVRIDNASLLFDKTNTLVAQDDSDLALRVYEALARCEGDYAGWGLHRPYDVAGSEDPLNVLKHIEDFYYEASRSTFEQIYKIRSR